MATKFCMSVDIHDVITSATFRLRGLGVARGRISRFPIDLRRRPYNTLALPCECVMKYHSQLLEHAMKVIERVFERRIRVKVKTDAMHFGFMPGKGTTDAIFSVRQMQDKYGCKRKKLYFDFVDFEKAFDIVPRGLLNGL